MAKYQFTKETQDKINLYNQADQDFKAAWAVFEQKMAVELQHLDQLREDRNVKLDEAKRAARTEAAEVSISDAKSIAFGGFSVMKKWSDFYIPEKLVALLKDKGLYDAALAAKAVAEKIEVAKFDEVKAFLQKEGVDKDFEECEDGIELTPAVTGPKPIPALGAEYKDAK